MGAGTRQWKALMRKNFITWKRNAGCSTCEIACPSAMMFLMLILRNIIDPTTYSTDDILKATIPIFPGLTYTQNDCNPFIEGNTCPTQQEMQYGYWGYDNLLETNYNVESFFKWLHYPYGFNTQDEYEVNSDVMGPFYFVPTQCLQQNSFQTPPVTMPVIAIVGVKDELNEPSAMMKDYLDKLHTIQTKYYDQALKPVLLGEYDDCVDDPEKCALPVWEYQYYDSKDAMFDYAKGKDYTYNDDNPGICFGFEFTESSVGDYELDLFFDDQQIGGSNSVGIAPSNTQDAYDSLASQPNAEDPVIYLKRGFSILQNLGANIALMLQTDNYSAQITMYNMPMQATDATTDPYESILTGVLPYLLLLIFIPPVYNTVFMIVREKETRMKESMRMMGMRDVAYWLSWWAYYSCVTTVICLLSWGILMINVIENSDAGIILLYFIFYAQAIFAEIIFIQSLFESSKYSGLVGSLIYYGLWMFCIPVLGDNAAGSAKAGLSIIPQVAMQMMAINFGKQETSKYGLTWSNIGTPVNNFAFSTGFIMMFISFFLFAFLGFWLEKVMPRTFGEKLPCCFCFMRNCGRKQTEVEEEQFSPQELQRRGTLRDSNNQTSAILDPFEIKYLDKKNYEPVPPEVARLELQDEYLKIEGLQKVYPDGKKAVQGINLKMYNGQIFSLLGHNGAGKSTTISMLTGLLSRTAGNARCLGNDLFNNMSEVRKYMGVCPQHDVLFDVLTPEEHLDIFYDFKGGDPALKANEIQAMIVDSSLDPDRKKNAKSLSGGNRRKLSVCISLCGNSRLVLLDEPTAGMDISARRALWNMLKNYKNNRIIILTTHYMDEADVLGDRIGIMANGKVLCLGSSLFLKNRYGAGYKLTMVKKFKTENQKIQPYLEGIFGKVEKLSEVSQEITFKINYDQAAQFQSFFEQFDERMSEVDILSYGVSMTTLEEVFLKVNEDDHKNTDGVQLGSDSFFAQEPKDHRGSSINNAGGIEEEKNQEPAFGDNLDQAALDAPKKDKDDEEKKGCCDKGVEECTPGIALTALILNCIPVTPGVGTMVSACCNNSKKGFNCWALFYGILQLLLGFFVIGWVWSIFYGCMIYEVSMRAERQRRREANPLDLRESPTENLVGNGSVCESIKALLSKRFYIYKRDCTGLICELIVPIILVFIGLQLLQITYLKNSPSLDLNSVIDVFPGPQRPVINLNKQVIDAHPEYATDTAISSQDFIKNLPGFTEGSDTYWEPTYVDNGDSNDSYSWEQFQKAVFDAQYTNPTKEYRFGSYYIYEADKTLQVYNVALNFNATSPFSLSYFQQYAYASILANQDQHITYTVKNSPFPSFQVFKNAVDQGQAIDFAVILSIALALIPCVIIAYIIKERVQQLKHMQLISGVSLPAYWLSNLIADIGKTFVPMLITFVLMGIYGVEDDGAWALLLLYPIAIVPFTYITSFAFSNDTVAQIMTIFLHFLFGAIAPIVVISLQSIESTASTGDSLRYAFTIVPTYCVGHGLIVGATAEGLNQVRSAYIQKNDDLPSISKDAWAFENVGADVLMMAVVAAVCTLVLFLVEADIFQCCSKCSVFSQPPPRLVQDLDLDEDVLAEEERLALQTRGKQMHSPQGASEAPLLDPENLQKDPTQMDVVRVHTFRKLYTTLFGSPFLAVERISFGLDYGECFALLGVNGAGKSTTFKSLTRDVLPTQGDLSIAGYDILKDFKKARKLIGYCPQHDAIFPLMTVEEHLYFYAKIKGVPDRHAEILAEKCMQELRLVEYRNKPAGGLSGGNKRKLSVCMAIIGNPPIVMLDEPSAGMDPEARRFMWSVVEKICQRDKKSAVILTSHSMEEAEALSTKMGIMVRGGIFRCFGSSQHIKNKFATGYELEVNIRKTTFAQLEEFKGQLRLQGDLNDKVSLQDAKELLMQNMDFNGLIVEQIRQGGIGSDLYLEAALNQGDVRMYALVNYLFVQANGFKFITHLAKTFEQVEMLEQCGNFYKLRVPRQDKSIGYLFGQIEGLKQEMNIQEYAVSQTSLEQIFQNFAHQDIDEKAAFTFKLNALDVLQLLNPDRKSTVLQKRMSMVGRQSMKSAGQSSGSKKKGNSSMMVGEIEDETSGPLIK